MLPLYSDTYIQDKFISYLVYCIICVSFAEILKRGTIVVHVLGIGREKKKICQSVNEQRDILNRTLPAALNTDIRKWQIK